MQISYIPAKPSRYTKKQEEPVTIKITDCRRFLTFTSGLLGLALTQINLLADVASVTAKADATGWRIFCLIRGFAFWGAVIMMVIDLIKNIRKEDISGVVRTALFYSAWYTGVYFAPQVVKLGVSIFE